MDKFLIRGGAKLKGEIEIGGAKNCALPVLFATLLSAEKHHVRRVPRLRDMDSTLSMIVHLGCSVDQRHARQFGSDWIVDATKLSGFDAPYDLVRKMRASTLVLGPLLARTGRARVSMPGGCAIGARPIDLHIMALEKLGAVIKQSAGFVEATFQSGKSSLTGGKIVFPFVSVGATENALMAASLARGSTQIENAAREPEITGLCEALVSMGAEIEGLGSSTLIVHGKEKLGAMNYEIIPDRVETATYLIAAQMTGGSIDLRGANASHLEAILEALKETGATIEVKPGHIKLQASKEICPVNISTAPYPAFPTDVQAQWVALMTQAKGSSTVTETIFENRFMHVPELKRMGAKIDISGNTLKIHGTPQAFEGAPVMATDLRASASLVLAGLVAHGETSVKRIYHLDRGYESMEIKLRALGADVDRTVDD